MTFPNGFRPGLRRYDQAEAIYRAVGARVFTWREISRMGLEISPGALTALRTAGILTHPTGEGSPRRRQYRGYARTWALTPRAIQFLQRHAQDARGGGSR